MENKSSPDRVHGMLIAHASLLKSLVSVLPLEALQALLPELERDTEFARGFFLPSEAPESFLEAHDATSQQNLDFVRDQLRQKEAMHTPGGALQWMQDRERPSDPG